MSGVCQSRYGLLLEGDNDFLLFSYFVYREAFEMKITVKICFHFLSLNPNEYVRWLSKSLGYSTRRRQ